MTLTEFLLARIAEDETVAERWPPDSPPPDGFPYWIDTHAHPIWQPKARVLAECKAKREFLSMWPTSSGTAEFELTTFLQLLAAVYADHPDYQPDWRPG